MSRRAAAVEETRRRIVSATMEVHAEQGIAASSFQDVARRADVSVGTVYRHFPTMEELVSACGEQSAAWIALPTPERAAALFAGATRPAERIARLVGEVARIYAMAAIGFLRVREARDELAAAAEGHARWEGAIDALVDEALAPLDLGDERRATVRALLDARVWQTLTDRGLDADGTRRALEELVACATGAQAPRSFSPGTSERAP